MAPSTRIRWVLACRDAARRLGKGFPPLTAREEGIVLGSMEGAVLLLIWERSVTAFTMISGFVNSPQTTTFMGKFPAFKESQARTAPGYSISSRSMRSKTEGAAGCGLPGGLSGELARGFV